MCRGYRGGGTTFRNVTEVAEYFADFISYYTAGGFTDSRTGKRYDGYHYNIPWFEFGNEMGKMNGDAVSICCPSR